MKATSKHLLAVTVSEDPITNGVKPLFAFPVDVVKATEDSKSPFEVAAPSGAKRVQQYVDTATGEIVEDSACPRGVFVGDEFRAIDEDARNAIAEATKIETMVALDTIKMDEFRERYADRIVGRYFLQSPAKGGSAKSYRLVLDALKAEGVGIITKRTARSKQKLAVIYPDVSGKFLTMVEVVFPANVREPDSQVLQPLTVEVEQAQIDMARKVIGGIGSGDGAVLDTEVDEAVALQDELIAKAVEGEEVVAPKPVSASVEQDDLMGALTASLEAVGAA